MSAAITVMRWTEVVACHPCDPDVGTGQKPALCRSLCRQWFRSCRTSYFEQSRADSRLVPCRVGALICAQAQELSGGAEEFCSDAGFAVQQQSPCYDGSVPEPHESCRRPQSPALTHRRQSAQQRAPGVALQLGQLAVAGSHDGVADETLLHPLKLLDHIALPEGDGLGYAAILIAQEASHREQPLAQAPLGDANLQQGRHLGDAHALQGTCRLHEPFMADSASSGNVCATEKSEITSAGHAHSAF
eukprot:jgi/Astpho2/8816/Aster-x1543